MRIRTCIVLCVLILVGVVSVAAQGDLSFNAAVRAARAAKPDIGQVTGSSWARLNPTKLSNLHCPLVQGTDLGREVTVYEWDISFATGTYKIYASTDGTVTQLCDSKFGSVVASTPAPPSGCQIAATAQPTFRIAPEPSTAILGGEVMTNGINYAIGRTDTRDWYQTRNKANQIGWVSVKEVTLSGACDDLPITGARDIDHMDSTCFVTTAQDYSNVRETPSTDAKVLAGIYENSYWQVYASAGADTEQWYFINTGWVAARVTEQYGQCDNLRYDPSLRAALPENVTPTATAQVVGTPAATLVPTMTATPLFTNTPLPADLACPADFEGFLEPRLTIGAATARLVEGGEPNRLRSDPTTQALQVGVAQPGRTLDMVLAGPACSDTYVWWFVRIDGVDGWTVESDSSDEGTYFLEPIGGASGPSNVPAVATANPTRIIEAPGATAEAVATDAIPGLVDSTDTFPSEPIESIEFRSAEWVTFMTNDLYNWSLDTERENRLHIMSDVMASDYAQDNVYWLWSTVDKTALIVLDTETLTAVVDEISPPSTELSGFVADTPTLSMTSDGRYFITVGCNDADCSKGKIDLWETATGKLIRSQPAHPGLPMGAWFTPDDTHILSIGGDGIQVWDTQSGSFVGGVALDIAAVTNMASNPVISSDSAYYYIAICTEATGPFECTKTELLGWELATSKEVTRLELTTDKAASALAISDDDLQLAVGFQGPTIQFVELDPTTTAYVQGNTLNVGEALTVSALTFSSDGTRLAVGTDNGTAQLWDVPQA